MTERITMERLAELAASSRSPCADLARELLALREEIERLNSELIEIRAIEDPSLSGTGTTRQ